jgi:hypothetical protein
MDDVFENIGAIDRLLRYGLGSLLIGTAFFEMQTPIGWYAVLPLIGTYPIFTALLRFDPVYKLFRLRTS